MTIAGGAQRWYTSVDPMGDGKGIITPSGDWIPLDGALAPAAMASCMHYLAMQPHVDWDVCWDFASESKGPPQHSPWGHQGAWGADFSGEQPSWIGDMQGDSSGWWGGGHGGMGKGKGGWYGGGKGGRASSANRGSSKNRSSSARGPRSGSSGAKRSGSQGAQERLAPPSTWPSLDDARSGTRRLAAKTAGSAGARVSSRHRSTKKWAPVRIDQLPDGEGGARGPRPTSAKGRRKGGMQGKGALAAAAPRWVPKAAAGEEGDEEGGGTEE